MINSLTRPTRFLFFTGKGGVGKTSAACAEAIALAEQGKRVLIVSTDPASNLDSVLGTKLAGMATPIVGVEGLFGLNIDPEASAQAYRERVAGPYRDVLPADSVAAIEEQLSGACTVEIAAFDEFTGLMSKQSTAESFDHVIFDTAPTGHTLRLLQLPAAWSSFIESNAGGASCLGPLSGLKNQQARYAEALAVLGDGEQTTLVLVTRPELGALAEAERTRAELTKQGIANQFLIVNGVFRASDRDDEVAMQMQTRSRASLEAMSEGLRALPSLVVPLKSYNVVGLEALRDFFSAEVGSTAGVAEQTRVVAELPRLVKLADEVEAAGHGLVMFMGKGGVGKTTMAAAFAVELASRGHHVHLTTTDPAAHIEGTLQQEVENLRVSRIDPQAETEAYRQKVIERSREGLDAEGLALLEEDLRSPCTEEVAVFHAFSRVVFSAKREIVVVDTAPTGHTLLLLDATGSYHREMLRQQPGPAVHITTPLMRLQDPAHARVVIVTLAETTPVQEAAHLQEDLRRAAIEPYAWVINRSLAATPTRDPLLRARAREEADQIETIRAYAETIFVVPWSAEEPRGAESLRRLIAADS
ncbi:MAG: arsenical pump-driving ATPase [Bradymonadaceae bacterium]|nr:arsenical pump-driving ATPase [Lujinxingiaceae bacterium]